MNHSYVEGRLLRWSYWFHAGRRPGPERVISWWGPLVLNGNVEQIGKLPQVRVDPTEAEETDAAVRKLPQQLRSVVEEHWIRRGTVLQKCRALHVSRAIFYSRLDRAYNELLGLMNDALAAKRERA